MPKVILESREAVAILRLNNGVTNAIGPELVADLSDAVQQLKSEFKYGIKMK